MNFCSQQKLFGMHLHFSRPLDPIDLIWVVLFVLQLRLQGLFLPDKKFFFFIFFIFVIFDYLNITKHLSKKSNFCLQEEHNSRMGRIGWLWNDKLQQFRVSAHFLRRNISVCSYKIIFLQKGNIFTDICKIIISFSHIWLF